MRAPEKKRVRRTAGTSFRPAHAATSRSKRMRAAKSSPFRWLSGEHRELQRRPPRNARESFAPACRSPPFRRAAEKIDKEIDLLVRRLAESGLLDYCLSRAGERRGPRHHRAAGRGLLATHATTRRLRIALVLSRFAYMRRRGNDMVLESPRAGALFRICDPKIAATLAMLSTPQQIKQLRRQDGFPGLELLALLLDCQILFKVDAGDSGPAGGGGRREPRPLGLPRSSVPRAQHGRPARQSAGRCLSLMPASFLRRRRCGPVGPARKSIWARPGPRLRRHSRRSQSFCASAFRRGLR